jgi:hypothetical protein
MLTPADVYAKALMLRHLCGPKSPSLSQLYRIGRHWKICINTMMVAATPMYSIAANVAHRNLAFGKTRRKKHNSEILVSASKTMYMLEAT